VKGRIRLVLLALVGLAGAAVRSEASPGDRPASARAIRVRWLALPSRREHAALADLARRTAAALAVRVGGAAVAGPAPADEVRDGLARGLALSAKGRLDQAAAALDAALEAGARAPHRIADPERFLAGHAARISIALARGEAARADALLARLLQYDPGFALSAAEESPRMREAIERARTRAGPRPALAIAALGDACAGRDLLVVARGLATGTTELLRFDGCRLVAQAAVRARFEPADAAALLDPVPRPRLDTREAAREESPPFYRRAWFWTAVGAVVIGSGAAIYAGTRGPDEVTVVPHL